MPYIYAYILVFKDHHNSDIFLLMTDYMPGKSFLLLISMHNLGENVKKKNKNIINCFNITSSVCRSFWSFFINIETCSSCSTTVGLGSTSAMALLRRRGSVAARTVGWRIPSWSVSRAWTILFWRISTRFLFFSTFTGVTLQRSLSFLNVLCCIYITKKREYINFQFKQVICLT